MNVHEAVRVALVDRVLNDQGYCAHRLGRVPSGDEVADAAVRVADRAVLAVVVALDPYEEEVWALLEGPRG